MRRGISIIGLATLPLAALAQDQDEGLDYTYVEGGYLRDAGPYEPDSSDGLGLRGSFALTDLLHLFGEYSTQDFGDSVFDVELSIWTVGVGLHKPLQPKLDFIGELGWMNAESESPFGGGEDDGISLTAGLRYRASDSVELEGSINHVDLESSDTSVALRGRYYFNRSFAVTGGLLLDEGDTGVQLGFRAEFGGR